MPFGCRCSRLKLSRDYTNPITCLQTDTGSGINNCGGGGGEMEEEKRQCSVFLSKDITPMWCLLQPEPGALFPDWDR